MNLTVIAAVILIALGALYFALGRTSKVQSYTGPIPAAGDPMPKSFALTVIVKDSGVFEVDGVAVDLARVKKLIAEKTWDEQAGIKIKRDPKAPYEAALPVLDAARQGGVSRISVE